MRKVETVYKIEHEELNDLRERLFRSNFSIESGIHSGYDDVGCSYIRFDSVKRPVGYLTGDDDGDVVCSLHVLCFDNNPLEKWVEEYVTSRRTASAVDSSTSEQFG